MKFILKVFLFCVALVLIFGDEAFDYCSLTDTVCNGKRHIACGPFEAHLDIKTQAVLAERVNITLVQLSDSEKASLIKFMNTNRNKIALGQTQLPKGSNLPKTAWDEELELFAKSLAAIHTIRGLDYCLKRRNGQTIFKNVLQQEINPRTAHDALEDVFVNNANNIANVYSTKILKQIAFVSKLGCYFGHLALQNDSVLFEGSVSCVFDFGVEPELVLQLYAEGEPCSNCTNNVGCDSEFLGLCATV